MDADDLANRFTYHPPTGDQRHRYELIRDYAHGLVSLISNHCPDSDERDNAIDRVDEAIMWANASIARHP
jgi:dihydroorotase-like cyclic amidohydrolase